MAHALDHFFTGINTAFTGKYDNTPTSQLLQMGGVSPQHGNTTDNSISISWSDFIA